MDLSDYADAVFALAAIARDGLSCAKAEDPDSAPEFEEILKRLADDRFIIAVVGQFSRGKTSLMNALLRSDRLPTGVVPVTSVITEVDYGISELVEVQRADWSLAQRIEMQALPDFVSQQGNPGNVKGIKRVHIEMPSELLRHRFTLVDTPGLGSAYLENTATTEEFLPQADAVLLVTSYESPLSQDEFNRMQALSARGVRVFVVLNKSDLISDEDRRLADAHVAKLVTDCASNSCSGPHSVSAQMAIRAASAGNEEQSRQAGVSNLANEIIAYVLHSRQRDFLRRIRVRLAQALATVPQATALSERLRKLGPAEPVDSSDTCLAPAILDHSPERFRGCTICQHVEREMLDFLRKYQFRIMVDPQVRSALAQANGLCAFHTWQYAALASPHGTCVAFPDVVEHLGEAISAGANEAVTCEMCNMRERYASAAWLLFGEALRDVARTDLALCMPHFQVAQTKAGSLPISFKERQQAMWRRMASDMRRYALKRDGSRGVLRNADDLDADVRGLRLIAGHRSLGYAQPRPR